MLNVLLPLSVSLPVPALMNVGELMLALTVKSPGPTIIPSVPPGNVSVPGPLIPSLLEVETRIIPELTVNAPLEIAMLAPGSANLIELTLVSAKIVCGLAIATLFSTVLPLMMSGA